MLGSPSVYETVCVHTFELYALKSTTAVNKGTWTSLLPSFPKACFLSTSANFLIPGDMKNIVYGTGVNVKAADTANMVRLFDATHDKKPEVDPRETGADEK